MELKITIGQMKHRVTIQATTAVQDSSASYSESWSDVATVWARVRPLTGREYYVMQQGQSEVTHEIVIRYRRGVTTANRLKLDARILDIQSVVNYDEKNEWMIIHVIERTT